MITCRASRSLPEKIIIYRKGVDFSPFCLWKKCAGEGSARRVYHGTEGFFN